MARTRRSLVEAGFALHGDDDYRIPIPGASNLYRDTVGKWAVSAQRGETALIVDDGKRPPRTYSFGDLAAWSSQFARLMKDAGVGAGVPVAVHTGQSLATAVA